MGKNKGPSYMISKTLLCNIFVCPLFTDTENRIYFRNKFSFQPIQSVHSTESILFLTMFINY